MAGNSPSKNKGSNGEREACRYLSNLFGGSFIRNPSSGAFIGAKNSFRKATLSQNQITHAKADIVPPDHMTRLVLEIKWYQDFAFNGLLTGSVSMLDTWIKQCLDVIDDGDEWFVCFKINRLGWWISVPDEQAKHYTFRSHCRYEGKHGTHYVGPMEPFFEDNKEMVLSRTAR